MTENSVNRFLLLALSLLCLSCASPPGLGDPGSGFRIEGYVGRGSTTAAVGEQVVLLSATTGEPIATDQTNFFGKYGFEGLPAGGYRIQVGSILREAVLVDKNVRLDIDLTAADGRMDYAKGAIESATKGATGSSGPTDPAMMQQMAGTYWGYTGSTESKLTLCPDGRFHDSSESSYSGTSTDGLGDQTLAWGAAGQNQGSGSWSIQGNLQQGTITVAYSGGKTRTIQYQAGSDRGCFHYDGRQMCRTGDADCP